MPTLIPHSASFQVCRATPYFHCFHWILTPMWSDIRSKLVSFPICALLHCLLCTIRHLPERWIELSYVSTTGFVRQRPCTFCRRIWQRQLIPHVSDSSSSSICVDWLVDTKVVCINIANVYASSAFAFSFACAVNSYLFSFAKSWRFPHVLLPYRQLFRFPVRP